jgi:dTDP-4-amino-4,6-dideoxygalactose transaminase
LNSYKKELSVTLFKTKINDEDVDFISDVIRNGNIGFGDNVNVFEKEFRSFSKKQFNVATNSASASAYMIFAYLMEKFGKCDVYTTSIGFVSPAWSAMHLGHNVIFVDVDDNLLFDINHYKSIKKETGRKKVLMPVLYGGVSTIQGFENLDDEIVIVDAAHCVTPTIKSDYTFFSFHPLKPIACSDGGMISTDDIESYNFFNLYRNFGRHHIGNTYDVVSDGFKFYMNNLNATIAITQMNRYNQNLDNRKECHILVESLNLNGRLLPHDSMSSYYFATLICAEDSVEHLLKEYPTVRHYPMIHKTKLFDSGIVLENTEKIHKLILNLPLYDQNIYHSRSRG